MGIWTTMGNRLTRAHDSYALRCVGTLSARLHGDDASILAFSDRRYGRGVMHYAAAAGHTEVIDWLMARACDAQAVDIAGMTAIFYGRTPGIIHCSLWFGSTGITESHTASQRSDAWSHRSPRRTG